MNIRYIFRRPYIYALVLIAAAYLALAILISGFYTTFQLIIRYSSTINWLKLSISLALTLAISVLVAMTSILLYARFKERQKCAQGGTLATLGTIGGLITGVCPLCVVGIVPLILSALGVTFSFAILPFGGIEVQVIVVIVLGISLKILSSPR